MHLLKMPLKISSLSLNSSRLKWNFTATCSSSQTSLKTYHKRKPTAMSQHLIQVQLLETLYLYKNWNVDNVIYLVLILVHYHT